MTSLYSIKRDYNFLGIKFCGPLPSLVLALVLFSSLGVYEDKPPADIITILRPTIRHLSLVWWNASNRHYQFIYIIKYILKLRRLSRRSSNLTAMPAEDYRSCKGLGFQSELRG